MVLASSIYIYRVYVDSHSLGQLALASKRTASMGKITFFCGIWNPMAFVFFTFNDNLFGVCHQTLPNCRCRYCIQMLSLNQRIRTKIRPNTTIRDRSHVNMASGCLVQRHIRDLHWVARYNCSRQMVKDLCGFCTGPIY